MANGFDINAETNSRMQDTLANMQAAAMTETMRSFKDSISFQFQSLNLALTSLNSNIATLATKLGNYVPGTLAQGLPANYITASNPNPTYLGDVNPMHASLTSNLSWSQTAFPQSIPSIIGGIPYAYNAYREAPFKYSNMLLGAGGSVASTILELGGGLGGALLGMPLGAPGMLVGGLLGGALGSAPIKPFVEDAIVHNKDVFNVQRLSRRFGALEFSVPESQRVVRAMENMAYRESMTNTSLDPTLGMSGFREMTMMGVEAGLFRGRSSEELINTIRKAAGVVKFFGRIMGDKTVKETMETLIQLKNMGVNPFESANFTNDMAAQWFKTGANMGVAPNQLANMAANIAMATFGAAGNAAFVGLKPATTNIALASEYNKRHMLTPGEIAIAGGEQALAQKMTEAQARILNSGVGIAGMYATMNPNGTLRAANPMTNPGVGLFDMISQGTQNFFNNKGDMFKYYVNRHRAIEKLGKGEIDEATTGMLYKQLQLNPFIKEFEAEGNDEAKMAAAIMQIMSQGYDVGTATAMAYKVYKPSVQRRMQARADIHAARAEAQRAAMHSGFGYYQAKIKSIPQKLANRFLYNFNLRDKADQLSLLTSEVAHGETVYAGIGEFNDPYGIYKKLSTIELPNKSYLADPITNAMYQGLYERYFDEPIFKVPGRERFYSGDFLDRYEYLNSRTNKYLANLYETKDPYAITGQMVDALQRYAKATSTDSLSLNSIRSKINRSTLFGEKLDGIKIDKAIAQEIKEKVGTYKFLELSNDKLKQTYSRISGKDRQALQGILLSALGGRPKGYMNIHTYSDAMLNVPGARSTLEAIAANSRTSVDNVLFAYAYGNNNFKGMKGIETQVDPLTDDIARAKILAPKPFSTIAAGLRYENGIGDKTHNLMSYGKDGVLHLSASVAEGMTALGFTDSFAKRLLEDKNFDATKFKKDSDYLVDLIAAAANGKEIQSKDFEKFTNPLMKAHAEQILNINGFSAENSRAALRRTGGDDSLWSTLKDRELTEEDKRRAKANLAAGIIAQQKAAAGNQIKVGLKTLGIDLSPKDIETLVPYLSNKEGLSKEENDKGNAVFLDLVDNLVKGKGPAADERRNLFAQIKEQVVSEDKYKDKDPKSQEVYMEAVRRMALGMGTETIETNKKAEESSKSKIDGAVEEGDDGGKVVRVVIKNKDYEQNAKDLRETLNKLASPTEPKVTPDPIMVATDYTGGIIHS